LYHVIQFIVEDTVEQAISSKPSTFLFSHFFFNESMQFAFKNVILVIKQKQKGRSIWRYNI